MIGLRRHTVRVVEYDAEWASIFETESRAVRKAGGDLVLDVQHVGSTAVPGLPAKPVVDIAVAVGARDAITRLVGSLTAIGYIDRGDGGSDGGYLLVRESEPDVRTVHLHVVEQTDVQWNNYLAFRNTLCQDSKVRQRYAELKRQLVAKFGEDRKAYTASKNNFIREVLKRHAQVTVQTSASRPDLTR